MATSILLSHPFLTKPKIPYQSSNPYHFPHLKPIKHNPFKTHLPNALISSKKSLLLRVLKTESEGSEVSPLVGEDSAEFELSNQKISSWVYFSGILGTVLYILNVAWIDNSSGYGKVFGEAISSVSESPEVVMLALILIFAIVHSGLASLRDRGEKLIGERAFRVLLAGVSLPLAVTTVVYFISHRYDGVQLWQLQGTPGLHEIVWISNFITLFFLYPSIFNLLEVAAVDKPKMHLWETGIMRITRHPQLLILKQILVHVTWESESFGLVSPAASFVPWSTRNKVEFKMSQLPVQKSCFNGTKDLRTDGEHAPFPGFKWRMIIAYDGTRFSGWQYQQSPPTVQCLVEEALTQITKLDREELQLVGAGRTDAGVHAAGQVAHFLTPFNYANLEEIHRALNGLLPPDIRIREISSALPEFHARFSVTSKIYKYKIYNDAIMDPFQRRYAYHSAYKLNADAMRCAAKHFVGKHDFTSFANASRNDRIPNPVKNIFRFDVNEMGPLLQLEVEGSGFLYRQVRNMVALLLQVGREALPAYIVSKVLTSCDRKELAKYSLAVPPHGLSLFHINYDEQHLGLPLDAPGTSLGRQRSIRTCKMPFY